MTTGSAGRRSTSTDAAPLGVLDVLPDAERAALAEVARTVRFPGGSYLYHAQMPGDSLHIITTGRVGIWAGGEHGRPTMVNTCGPGEMLGELAVLGSEQVRTASAQALRDVVTVQFDRRDIVAALERRPRTYLLFVDLLTQRVDRLTTQVAEFAELDGTTRVFRQLCRMADPGEPPGRRTSVPLTQHHLASLASVSLRLVSQALTKAQTDGLLRTGRGEIVVLDWPGARRRAGLPARR